MSVKQDLDIARSKLKNPLSIKIFDPTTLLTLEIVRKYRQRCELCQQNGGHCGHIDRDINYYLECEEI